MPPSWGRLAGRSFPVMRSDWRTWRSRRTLAKLCINVECRRQPLRKQGHIDVRVELPLMSLWQLNHHQRVIGERDARPRSSSPAPSRQW